MASFTLTVNGARKVVNAAPDTPLIYVLRNDLELSGPRLGCGMSQCGSCAVLADGKEIRSCTTPISRIGDRKIHTIEGLPGLWAAKKGLTDDKAAAVAASLRAHPDDPAAPPAARVRALDSTVWLVDAAAAGTAPRRA